MKMFRPNRIKPGWIAIAVTIFLGLVVLGHYLSSQQFLLITTNLITGLSVLIAVRFCRFGPWLKKAWLFLTNRGYKFGRPAKFDPWLYYFIDVSLEQSGLLESYVVEPTYPKVVLEAEEIARTTYRRLENLD